MKRIKYAVVLMLFIVGFVATAERFAYHLAHFEETFWRISFEYSMYEDGESREDAVKLNLQRSIEAYSFDVYYIETKYLSDYQEIRTVYGTNGALIDLYNRGIRPKTYHSIFSGEIKIVFKPFEEIEDIFEKNNFFVVGKIANAVAFKEATDVSHFYNVDDIKDVSGSEEGIYATLFLIWGIIFLLILLLTLYQNLLTKKEMVVRVTLGDSPFQGFLENAMIDTIVFIIAFFSVFFVFSMFLPVQYKFAYIAFLFGLMVIINIGIHFFQAKISLRKDLSKNLENKRILTISYIVKSVSILLTSCILSSNVLIISEAVDYFRQNNIWEQLGGYGYYGMTYPFKVVQDMGEEVANDEVLWSHFHKQFGSDAIWMVDVSESYNYSAVVLNKNAVAMMLPYVNNHLKNLLLEIKENKLYLFLPNACRDSRKIEQVVKMTTVAFLGNKSNPKNDLSINTYSGYSKILGVNRDTHLYGSKFLNNPIIIVDTRDYMASKEYLNVMYLAREVLYRLDDGEFQSFLDLEMKKGGVTRVTDAVSLYEYNQSSIVKGAKLMLAVSLFILFLELMMIVFLVRLEYTMNGMEIAIKKTLGYSCLERTKKISIITAISIFSCTFLAITVSCVFGLTNNVLVCACGTFLFMVEMGLIMYEAVHMDHVRVCLILRGAQI